MEESLIKHRIWKRIVSSRIKQFNDDIMYHLIPNSVIGRVDTSYSFQLPGQSLRSPKSMTASALHCFVSSQTPIQMTIIAILERKIMALLDNYHGS